MGKALIAKKARCVTVDVAWAQRTKGQVQFQRMRRVTAKMEKGPSSSPASLSTGRRAQTGLVIVFP